MIIKRSTKLRWRRVARRKRRQVEDFGVQAEENIERHIFKRLRKFPRVRNFILCWVGVFILLSGVVIAQLFGLSNYYQSPRPVAGGMYTEGVVGSFTNANPLYVNSAVDSAVSKLIFSGLLRYDENNKLVGDLAEKWSVDESGKTYTVTLRPNTLWHDGYQLTAQDVVFTFAMIQNADAKSPLFSSWQGIKVQAVNDRTINFVLPNVLASFPASLTTGIIPKHILGSTPATTLRSVRFNTVEPVGSGPFKFEAIEVAGDTPDTRQEQIVLLANDKYYRGAPKLQKFTIKSFRDEKMMLESYKRQELTAMSGLSSLPKDLSTDIKNNEINVQMTSEAGVFFRTPSGVLADASVRRALTQAVNQLSVLKGLGYATTLASSPLLPGQVGYDPGLKQLPFSVDEANKLLDGAGWKMGGDKIRVKDGKPLTFSLYAQANSENTYVAQVLQQNWVAVGAKVEVMLLPDSDFKKAVTDRRYDALLYGISIGTDPDIFAYWHSSQADPLSPSRLNFSDYKSTAADKALEDGRARLEPDLRTIKYKKFLETWRSDAPAAMLYTPRYLYVTHSKVYNFAVKQINEPTDRYANVANWMIDVAKITN